MSDKFFDPDVDEPFTAGEALQTLASFANTAPGKLPARVERALELAREVSAATVVHKPLDPGVAEALEQAPEWDSQIDLRLGTSLRPQARGEVWFAEVELDVYEDSEGSDQRAAAFVRFLGGLRRRHLRDAFYAHRALLVRPLPRKKDRP